MDKDRAKKIGAAISGLTLAAVSCNALTVGLTQPAHAEGTPTSTGTGTVEASVTPFQPDGLIVTPTPMTDWEGTVWTGQTDFNQLRLDINPLDTTWSEDQAFRGFLDNLVDQKLTQEIRGMATDKSDSAFTAFTNEFKGPQFDTPANPLDETGHEFSATEISQLRDGGNIMSLVTGNQKVGELIHQNENDANLKWVGTWGRGDDLDAMTAVLATTLQAELTGNEALQNTSVGEAVSFSQGSNLNSIAELQAQIESRIVKKDLGLSQSEIERRADNPEIDASAHISPVLRGDDQKLICEEVRGETGLWGNRDSQPQTLIEVEHVADDVNTLTQTTVQNEVIALVLTIDGNGNWDVTGFTSRGFENDPLAPDLQTENAVSGNELVTCGVGGLVPTNTVVPGQAPQPTRTNRPPVIETTAVPPTTVEDTVTPGATQPPQPTRTPGGNGETPIVPSPINTAVPTQQVEPTIPPPAEPSSTPAF